MHLRNLKKSDIEPIAAFFAAMGIFRPDELSSLKEDMEDYLDGRLVQHCGQDEMRVLEYEGEQVGLIHYGPVAITDRTWCMYWIGVNPILQAKGLGKKLVEEMEKELRQRNARLITAETSSLPAFQRTRSFYLRIGYNAVAQVPDFYAPQDHKVLFQKWL